MTPYEIARILAEPFLPLIYSKVRHDLRALLRETAVGRVSLLDVGGRKSPYTIGLPCDVTVIDLPRSSDIQKHLYLGITEELLNESEARRSNIKRFVLEDMTQTSLPSNSFDGVVSIEVIEHVPDDRSFVEQIARVLKPGGWAYLTTPNGDYVRNEPPNYNPDHIRHYSRQQLHHLLVEQFDRVDLRYGVKAGKYRYWGLRSMNIRRPIAALKGATGNVINRFESRNLDQQARRTTHLFAIVRKAAF